MGEEPETSPDGQKRYFDEHPRLMGVVLWAFALVFAYWAFYLPVQEASQGAPEIKLYPKAIYTCIMFTTLGVICLILGPKTYPLALKFAALRGWKKWLTFAVIIILLLIVGEVARQGLERYLEGFGYKF